MPTPEQDVERLEAIFDEEDLKEQVGVSASELKNLLEAYSSEEGSGSSADFSEGDFSHYLDILAEDFYRSENDRKSLGRRVKDD